MQRKTLVGLFPEEISAELGLDKPFRGRQIFSWIARGCRDFALMSDLGLELRERLVAGWSLRAAERTDLLADEDGTLKLQVSLADGSRVEAVLLADQNGRRTACLSTQAGCAMGCAFCRTGQLGFRRNLKAAEIFEQYLLLREASGDIGNIVFMGMGEPLDNLDESLRAFRLFSHPGGLALSPRRITISTCGLVPGIRELADRGADCYLAVSLISADEKLRRELMPVARAHSLAELREALLYHHERIGRRLTLEVVLIRGLTDGGPALARLIDYCRGLDAIVNLIPWNPVEGLDFETPERGEVERFMDGLAKAGIPVTCRFRRGARIGGACGQLGVVWKT